MIRNVNFEFFEDTTENETVKFWRHVTFFRLYQAIAALTTVLVNEPEIGERKENAQFYFLFLS